MTFNELEIAVGNRIDELVSIDVHNSKVPLEEDYPCCIFTFEGGGFPGNTRYDPIVTIDFWSNSEDSSTIAAQADLLKAGFDYFYYSDSNGFYKSNVIWMGRIPDEKPNTRRIQQRYLIKAY